MAQLVQNVTTGIVILFNTSLWSLDQAAQYGHPNEM